LRVLVSRGGLSCGLEVPQRIWVLRTLPDLLFLLNQTEEAAALYRLVAGSGLSTASAWSSFQLANLDLLARRYAQAQDRYQQLCRQAETTSWQGTACVLADMMQTLQSLRKEGEPYGATASLR
jgi:hypothetical protein